MATGKVLWFNESKGYGFIEDEAGEQFLVRKEAIKKVGRKGLTPGRPVKFSVDKTTLEVTSKEVRLVKSLEIV